MAEHTTQAPGAPVRAKWPYQGRAQGLLLLAGLVTIGASFFTWIATPFGDLSGDAGLWTFYAGILAVPGAIWRSARIVLVHALILAVPATLLPLWRLAWAVWRLPAFGEAWLPGPGLVLVGISGGVATYAAITLWRRVTAQA